MESRVGTKSATKFIFIKMCDPHVRHRTFIWLRYFHSDKIIRKKYNKNKKREDGECVDWM